MEASLGVKMSGAEKGKAKARWSILASALSAEKKPERSGRLSATTRQCSVRSFSTFQLLSSKLSIPPEEVEHEAGYTWRKYKCEKFSSEFSPVVRHSARKPTAKELIGFNNTGNVCVWPSEEVLCYYILQHKSMLEGKRICELGAGMAGLAGFAAVSAGAEEVLLTDGNEESVRNLSYNVTANSVMCNDKLVSTAKVVWDRSDSYDSFRNKFDLLIAADCLFFTEVHIDLVHTIDTLLNAKGACWLVAPRRSGSLDKFVNKAKESFDVKVSHKFDERITKLCNEAAAESPDFVEDLHWPVFVWLTRKKGQSGP
eukprot:m.8542 g.8542  ORF g.8542 m.8542 type:complete len:313 (+) comp3915_c0_seq1:416-1354(+)